jgi:sulfite reductase (NADPH) flavoprotein alpha-component
MDLIDLIRIYPPAKPALFLELVPLLSGIAPRLYSISSSPRVHPNEVHLTVSKHRFNANGDERYGLCSTFLGDLPMGTSLQFYIHRNRAFKLPELGKDMIMIGPGTGVAPFRSFLADRDASGASGRNWFFFGEQHFLSDFLYQAEMQQYLQTGVLHKISLAFSRDQEEKIYVQHRMLEEAKELYTWLANGASVYISGTKDPMSKDVEKALLQIISTQGSKTEEEALACLEELKASGRYQKDVY